MKKEYIDILLKNGTPTGEIAKKAIIHKKGYYHNTAHVWLYTKSNDILLAQRSIKKTICPLLWDVSVAGHVDAGETCIEAALRETKEEIGLQLKPNNLQKIGVFLHESSYNNGKIQDNEFHQVYISELKTEFKQLNPQKEEVEALKLVSFKEFKALLMASKTNNHFISTNKSYYEFVLKEIIKKTST